MTHTTSHDRWQDQILLVGVVVGCVVLKNGKYLLVQENQPKVRGLWGIPGGHVDKGETLEQAAIREVKEETGCDVLIERNIAIYHPEANKTIKHAYLSRLVSDTLAIDHDEILDVQWFDFETIRHMHADGKIRDDWIFDAIRKVEEEPKK